MASRGDMWVVVPIRSLEGGKSRLGNLLGPEERRGLVVAMLEDVLRVLADVEELGGVLVISRDPRARALGRDFGAEALEEEGEGLNPALSQASDFLARRGAAGTLVLPADLPLISPPDVRRLLREHGSLAAPAVTLVPDRELRGTNALLSTPPGAVPFLFGRGSAQAHVQAARRQGLQVQRLEVESLALDIDTPEDLRLLSGGELRPGPSMSAWLRTPSVRERLVGGLSVVSGGAA